jgi:hypothetical protein
MDEKLITIAQFPDYIEAEMALQLLTDYGIKAVVIGENAANIYSGMPALGGYCMLQTLESQAEQARQILESHKKQETSEDDNDSKDPEDNNSFLMDQEP